MRHAVSDAAQLRSCPGDLHGITLGSGFVSTHGRHQVGRRLSRADHVSNPMLLSFIVCITSVSIGARTSCLTCSADLALFSCLGVQKVTCNRLILSLRGMAFTHGAIKASDMFDTSGRDRLDGTFNSHSLHHAVASTAFGRPVELMNHIQFPCFSGQCRDEQLLKTRQPTSILHPFADLPSGTAEDHHIIRTAGIQCPIAKKAVQRYLRRRRASMVERRRIQPVGQRESGGILSGRQLPRLLYHRRQEIGSRKGTHSEPL